MYGRTKRAAQINLAVSTLIVPPTLQSCSSSFLLKITAERIPLEVLFAEQQVVLYRFTVSFLLKAMTVRFSVDHMQKQRNTNTAYFHDIFVQYHVLFRDTMSTKKNRKFSNYVNDLTKKYELRYMPQVNEF